MMIEKATGKRLLKRLRLEAAIELTEQDWQEHKVKGLVWTGVSKASLQRRAGIGKNYIDMLDPTDRLAKRLKPLLRRAETTQTKRDVEQTRLERNRDLQKQLALQAQENQEIMNQLNRTRSELSRTQERLNTYERHYKSANRSIPDLMLLQSERNADINDLPQDERNGE